MAAELNAEQILREITKYVNEDVSFIDALVHYATIHEIEVEVLGEMVRRSTVMKAQASLAAEKLNLIPKVARLPV